MYSFDSVQTHTNVKNGTIQEVTETVRIRNGKGVKSVTVRNKNKVKTSTHPLTPNEMKNIQTKQFMPTLFSSCHTALTSGAAGTRRNKTVKKVKKNQ